MQSPRRLSNRTLNRTLLQRQLLDRRRDVTELEVLECLVGLHAQIPVGPYVGLWARLTGYDPATLSTFVANRAVVRTALMRSTIHLVTPADAMYLRPVLQPVLDRDLFSNSSHGKVVKDLDVAAVVTAGVALLEERARTPSELGRDLAQLWPGTKPESLAYTVRNLAALVQVPPRGLWGGVGRTTHACAESWLGRRLDVDPAPDRMVLRYLAAFGPATVNDIQAWCGLTRLAEVVARLDPQLQRFVDEQGRELVDLATATLPEVDTPAPPRLLPEYDNVFLSHADRSRIIPDGMSFAAYSRRHGLFMTARGGVLRGNLLVDGYLNGSWRVDREKVGGDTLGGEKTYAVVVEPFIRLSTRTAAAVEREAAALLRFAVPDGDTYDVQVRPTRD